MAEYRRWQISKKSRSVIRDEMNYIWRRSFHTRDGNGWLDQ